MNFSLILSNTKRSRVYFNTFRKKKFFFKNIIYYSLNKDDFFHKLEKYKFKSTIKFFKTNNINNYLVFNFIANIKSHKNFIYSGYPGEIITRNELLQKKNIFHCHAGFLPFFKGSTTIYYSILYYNKIYCSILKLNKSIDQGKIFYIKKFLIPKNLLILEKNFDSYIRAKTFVDFICNKNLKKNYNNKTYNNSNYYIAHPFIRSMVINNKYLRKKNFYNENHIKKFQ